MAKMVGRENEYLWKKESRYLDFELLLIFIFVIAGAFYLGYYFGAHVQYVFSKSIIIALSIGFLTLLLKAILRLADKKSLAYRAGRKGENSIYFTLKTLPDNFTVFQNVIIPDKNENIDFIVLGPTGLFTVEVKNYNGEITFSKGALLHNGKPFEKDIVHQSTRQWQAINSYFKDKIGKDIFVQPIIVFSHNAKLHFGMKQVVKNIVVIQKEWLIRAITERARIFIPEQIENYSKILSELVAK